MTTQPFLPRCLMMMILASCTGALLVPVHGPAASGPGDVPSIAPHLNSILPNPRVPTNSPIEFFRRLMVMSSEERDEALAAKSPSQQAVLQAKVKEYGQMSNTERELRLHLLQLRIYLLPLMSLPPAQRSPWIPYVPEKERAVIQSRLQDWDRLTATQQQQILQHDSSLHYFLYRRHANPTLEKAAIAVILPRILPTSRSRKVEQTLALWRSFPEEKRDNISRRLGDFLTQDPAARQKVLLSLTKTDRQQMELVLQRLALYPPTQPVQWVSGFRKFARLTSDERNRFLVHADRWRNMTPEERNLWRSLAARQQNLPPPPGSRPLPIPPQ